MKQKLQAQRGATIMAALLFFLVASVCGSIILAAATATLSRITTQAEDARAYYSLTSAAQLLREDLLNSHWQVEKTISASTSTYKISALDADGTFIKDLMSTSSGEGTSSVFKSENIIHITATSEGKTLPTIYAKPVVIKYGDLDANYEKGTGTELEIWLTNDPDGFDASGNQQVHNTFKEGTKTRQVYWLKLTLDSVKIPAGYVDKRDESGKGTIKFQIGWDNAEIQKLERTIPTTP